MIGFFGCAASRGGELVRVRLSRPVRRAPEVVTVSCPACGHRHTARPFWRYAGPSDTKQDMVVTVAVAAGDN